MGRTILERPIFERDLSSVRETIIVSPNIKRIAYHLQAGKKETVVVDGREGLLYDRVGSPVCSPDSLRVAFSAMMGKYIIGKKWFVVLDGTQGTEHGTIGDLT